MSQSAATGPAPRGASGGTGWLALLLLCTGLIGWFCMSGGAGFEPIDCWVAQTAREMRESGDWIVPRFSGETRMQKSPGPYWAVILASLARGTPVDEAAARLPNAIAAVVFVGVIFILARAIATTRAAIFAGFAAASSALLLFWSSRGASDFGLTTWVTLSLASVWIAAERATGWRRGVCWLLAYAAAGAGMLYKMPMPLVCVGLPAAAYVLFLRRWSVLRSGWHVGGLAVFAACWLPWALTVLWREPTALQKWNVEYVDRFTGALPNVEGQQTWPFYLLYVGSTLVYCLPYSLSLPAAIWRSVRRERGGQASVAIAAAAPAPSPTDTSDAPVRRGMAFCLIWFISLLLFFTASAGKEDRYILPALPPLFVLLGVELAAFFDSRRPRNARVVAALTWAVCIFVPSGLAAGVWGLRFWFRQRGRFEGVEWGQVWPAYAVLAGILAVGFCGSALLFARGRTNAAFAALVATMWGGWLWAWPTLMPVVRAQRPFKEFAAQLRERISRDEQSSIRQVGFQDSRIIWYSDYRFPRIIDQLKLLEMQGGRRSVASEARLIGEEMLRQCNQPQRALFLAPLEYYALFRVASPRLAARTGVADPPVHLWLRTRLGREDQHFVVFGNQPPSWEEPTLEIPEKLQKRLNRFVDEIENTFGTAPDGRRSE
ncbi:Undecaprenyl phosphate-alpha-4-amino-4-deoxy-L-arabinose arabinosyl transferase [Phycisphaerae bacterium RAS1]|nr:Undecaprenyl phosphate-alpha-4-amino-4-deoxy-L-arabinose arabinosyl transferase [Phycisphaerae bacterium RAS1]